MASVDIRGVAKSFGPVDVIRRLDLAIADGEFIVLVGPSGCGKSTLLRMIAGLEETTAGDIVVGGQRVNDLEPRDRDIAMVFQSYALYPHMRVDQNLSFNMRLRKRPKDEIAGAVQSAAGILGLGSLLERFPRQLSGGQRQRVAMGRAIVRHPKVFLFDEPLSNLDAKLRVQMRAEIRKLHLQLAATSIYVTHDQVEAMTMADRIVVMNKGEIEQVGSPLELYDRPATLFVAEFIGSPAMNLFDGTLEPGGLFRAREGWSLPLPAVEAPAAASRPAVLGVRPEHLSIGEAGPIGSTVQLVEHLGPESYTYCDGGRTGLVCVRAPRTFEAPRGQAVRLGVRAEAAHLFDAETGRSLRRGGTGAAGRG
ncbi:ABC transporter ATP-binding protein [Prosthecomicrobium sp. N25]|uniref:ABC transporter ATP-binding protein n=1 Tax=Prosthecomicrobium sp. N25 TaxID=3129254 RepID=UPI0030772F7E